MNTPIYHTLFRENKKIFALLIDPEKQNLCDLEKILEEANKAAVDIILLGGSLTSEPIDNTLIFIKQLTRIPVVLFPGNLLQLSGKADGILLLSLISGRNPEYLIGTHVLASRYLKNSGLEIIPTGYIMVDGHQVTSVEYISNTRPIPSDKPDIVVATALAGEQLGLKLIYLEAGSGAQDVINSHIISSVISNVTIPVIVGGGISNEEDIRSVYHAGANGVIVGTAVEKDYRVLGKLAAVRNEFNG